MARFIEDAEKTATKILTQKKKLLDKLAKTLIEKETLEKEEFENLIREKEKNIKKEKKPATPRLEIKEIE